jgi:hypothetical protein
MDDSIVNMTWYTLITKKINHNKYFTSCEQNNTLVCEFNDVHLYVLETILLMNNIKYKLTSNGYNHINEFQFRDRTNYENAMKILQHNDFTPLSCEPWVKKVTQRCKNKYTFDEAFDKVIK